MCDTHLISSGIVSRNCRCSQSARPCLISACPITMTGLRAAQPECVLPYEPAFGFSGEGLQIRPVVQVVATSNNARNLAMDLESNWYFLNGLLIEELQ